MDLSKLFSLNWHDVLQSLKTALFTGIFTWLTVFLTPIYNSITNGQIPTFTFDWRQVLISLIGAIVAALGSVVKRFLSNSAGQIGSEPK